MILYGVLLVVITIVVYMALPYSPVKKEYWRMVNRFSQEYKLEKKKIEEEDLKALPEALQEYFIKNGYIGIESASAIRLDFKNVDFSLGVNKPNIKIDYTVYGFAKEPVRIALIDSKMYGIPFQGIDTCKDGRGSMKGVIAKHIKLFNDTFESFIDSSYLIECFLHPSLALQDNITYKQLDDYSVEVTIRKNESITTGIIYFNKDYEITKFVDEKRFCSDTKTYERWTAITSNYKVINGINTPTKLQGVWNFNSGDLIYFDGDNMKLSYK